MKYIGKMQQHRSRYCKYQDVNPQFFLFHQFPKKKSFRHLEQILKRNGTVSGCSLLGHILKIHILPQQVIQHLLNFPIINFPHLLTLPESSESRLKEPEAPAY